MITATAEKKVFKPYLVEGGYKGQNIFRIMEEAEGISRESITNLLEQLPVSFDLKMRHEIDKGNIGEKINEPLEVYLSPQIIYIYPGRERILSSISMESPSSNQVIKEIFVDNLVDIICPGRGQLRSCIHFDPKILGVENWPVEDIEVDMYIYPKDETERIQIKPFIFGKREVLTLLDKIAGGEKRLVEQDLKDIKSFVMYAVTTMRSRYENPDVAEDYGVRLYYKEDWVKIFAAKNDTELVKALNELRTSIRFE